MRADSKAMGFVAQPLQVEKQRIVGRKGHFAPARQVKHLTPGISVGPLGDADDRDVADGPKAFEGLAQSMSKGPEAPSGGLMGEFSRGQLPPELEAAAFALAPGETGDVVSTSLGHHVLRVDSRSPAHAPDLEECRHRIRTLLFQQKQERSEREFIAGLLARAKVNHEAAQARPAES